MCSWRTWPRIKPRVSRNKTPKTIPTAMATGAVAAVAAAAAVNCSAKELRVDVEDKTEVVETAVLVTEVVDETPVVEDPIVWVKVLSWTLDEGTKGDPGLRENGWSQQDDSAPLVPLARLQQNWFDQIPWKQGRTSLCVSVASFAKVL